MQVEYLLNTGNLVSNSTLDLSQNTGFTVIAEKLNFFRYAPGLDESCKKKHLSSLPKFIVAGMQRTEHPGHGALSLIGRLSLNLMGQV